MNVGKFHFDCTNILGSTVSPYSTFIHRKVTSSVSSVHHVLNRAVTYGAEALITSQQSSMMKSHIMKLQQADDTLGHH